ncbi:MAG: hypothetical protein Fur0017_27470 [Anaerolineales bacterium]
MQFSKNSPRALLASLISPNKNSLRLLLVTGPRGSGKTLWCMDLVGRAHARWHWAEVLDVSKGLPSLLITRD